MSGISLKIKQKKPTFKHIHIVHFLEISKEKNQIYFSHKQRLLLLLCILFSLRYQLLNS
jgi:hypothetical protein